MHLNSEMTLQITTNYDVDSVAISYQGDAQHYFTTTPTIEDNKRTINIKITTAWRNIVMGERQEYLNEFIWKDYLTDKTGVFFSTTLTSSENKSYTNTFQLCIYDNQSS